MRKLVDYTNGATQMVAPSVTLPPLPSDKDLSTDQITQRLVDLTRTVNNLLKNQSPDYVDFFNIQVSNTGTSVTLNHGFNCAVRYSFLDLDVGSYAGFAQTILGSQKTAQDANSLSFQFYFWDTFNAVTVPGSLTVRVEPAV